MTCKSSLLLAASVLIGATGIFLVSKHYLHEGFEASVAEQVDILHKVVDNAASNIKNRLSKEGPLLAANDEGIEAFEQNDFQKLRAFADKAKFISGAGFVTLTDPNGIVIARAGSDKRGDSIATNALVSVAMRGQTKSDLVKMKNNGLSVGSAAPIMKNGKVLGTILLGEGFRTHAFADQVKAMTNLEVTVFDQDTRLSTTLITNGERATGTKVTNPDIINGVLQNGGVYHATANLFGKAYKTMYWPIKNDDNKILGMWFIGSSLEKMEKTVSAIAFACLLATAIIAVVLSLLGALFFRSMVLPLRKTASYATEVAKGDLEAPFVVKTRNDEVGDLASALTQMVSSLKGKISEADQAVAEAQENGRKADAATKAAEEAAEKANRAKSDGMHAAALQLEGMVTQLSQATNELSTQIQESDRSAMESGGRLSQAAAAMNEMNASMQEVAHNASSAASISEEARTTAAQGQQILSEAMGSINEVQDISQRLKDDMAKLHEHTQNISKIMDVISDIADQTNLLALNAAIEAARAGEAGRGFAVVADEVRKLAEKTMNSTNDVAKAISSIQESSQQSVDRMNQALESVDKANALARESGEALSRIVANVEGAADQVRAIASASEQQSAASEEINQSISIVNEMSAQTTQAMSEASKAVESLSRQAENLSSLVDEMKKA